MVRAILNKSLRQHRTKQQLYGHLPPITKTMQVRRTRHAGYCWRSKDELISDMLLWTFSHGRAKAGRPVRTYIKQPCTDTGCNIKDVQEAMDDREEWREMMMIYIYIYIYMHMYIYIYICVCIYMYISLLVTVVDGNQKVPFFNSYYTEG